MRLKSSRQSWSSVLEQRPGFILLAACAVQLVVWTLVPLLVNDALPIDVVEGYMWGREWVIGTYKHPALPAWILEATRLATGVTGWPAYLVSQVFVVATLAFVFLLGRELLGATAGTAGTLLLFGVYYFSWPTPEFNHNLAQMPFWAAFIWALWRAVEHQRLRNWLILGAVAGASLYTKLSTGAVLLVGAGWALSDAKARATLRTAGPWIAVATAAAITSPLIHWLWSSEFQALEYASQRARSGTSISQFRFVAGFVLMHAGLLVLLAASGLLRSRASQIDPSPSAPSKRARNYILIMSITPLVLVVGIAVALGIRMRPPWGTSLSIMSGLLAASLFWRRISFQTVRTIAVGAFIALILVPTVYVLDADWGWRKPYTYSKTQRTRRGNWPQQQIAERLQAAWHEATGRPLRIVIGDMPVAGMVALDAPELPSVMDLQASRSPWVRPEQLIADGAIVVWSAPGCCAPSSIKKLFPQMQGVTEIAFAWPRAPDQNPLIIGYGFIMPAPDPAAPSR